MIYNFSKILVLLTLLATVNSCGGGNGDAANDYGSIPNLSSLRHFLVNWGYNLSAFPDVDKFTLYYSDGDSHIELCNTDVLQIDITQVQSMDCEIDLDIQLFQLPAPGSTVFITMTATDSLGNESEHSPAYPIQLPSFL